MNGILKGTELADFLRRQADNATKIENYDINMLYKFFETSAIAAEQLANVDVYKTVNTYLKNGGYDWHAEWHDGEWWATHKIAFIKVLRNQCHIGLKEGKEAVEAQLATYYRVKARAALEQLDEVNKRNPIYAAYMDVEDFKNVFPTNQF